jgi:hypothetical protein
MSAVKLSLEKEKMMRIVKVCVGLVAILLVGIASTGSALAAGEEFLASEASKLIAQKVKNQVLVTNAGTMTCTGLKTLAGTSTAGSSTEQLVLIDYEGCTAFGFVNVTVSPVDLDLQANNDAKILKLWSIKTTGCEVSIPVQSVSQIIYSNLGKNIEVAPAISDLAYTAEGSVCKKDSGGNGTFKGPWELSLEGGGTLSWDS